MTEDHTHPRQSGRLAHTPIVYLFRQEQFQKIINRSQNVKNYKHGGKHENRSTFVLINQIFCYQKSKAFTLKFSMKIKQRLGLQRQTDKVNI